MKKLLTSLLAAAALCSQASASALLVAEETGGDVVITLSGSIDLTGLSHIGPVGGGMDGLIDSSSSTVNLYAAYGSRYFYSVSSVTGSFGDSVDATADTFSPSRSVFGVYSSYLGLDTEYVSGSALSGSMTFEGETFASLGLYSDFDVVYTLGNGETVTFSGTAVPEPATCAGMAGIAALGLAVAARRRRTA
jgi:hypothetical protein